MNRLIDELKTRARLRRNAAQRTAHIAAAAAAPSLRDCLNAVARDVGFSHWEHARCVLGGAVRPGEDHGAFWYAPRCASLLSPWFASYPLALAARRQGTPGVVLPYRRQVVLADHDFLLEIGLDPHSPLWPETRFDLVGSTGSNAWQALAWQRLMATSTRTSVSEP